MVSKSVAQETFIVESAVKTWVFAVFGLMKIPSEYAGGGGRVVVVWDVTPAMVRSHAVSDVLDSIVTVVPRLDETVQLSTSTLCMTRSRRSIESELITLLAPYTV